MSSVPESRLTLVQAGGDGVDVTAIGRSVRGATWIDAARLHNWIAGRGSMDVPAHAPMAQIDEGGTSEFRYWTKPRFQTARYAYHLSLTAAEGAPNVNVTIDSVTSSVPVGTRAAPIPVTLFRDRSSLSATEAELAITVDVAESTGYPTTVECIAVESVPRTELLVASDLGTNRLDYRARQLIDEASFATELLANQNDLRQAARRVGLFQFSRGTETPWTSASAVSANLFVASFSLTGRKLFNGQTSTTNGITKWRALAKCSDGTTAGTLTLTGPKVLTIPAGEVTSWKWITGASVSHDCEDNTTADGYQAGAPDGHNIAFVRTAGTGTVSVASVSFIDIGE